MTSEVLRLSFAQLDAEAVAFDARVAESPGVDLFCSSSAWILPACRVFARGAKPLVLRADAGYVALATLPLHGGGRAAIPLEATWGLASPFIGPHPEAIVEFLAPILTGPNSPADALFLSGLDPNGAAARALAKFCRRCGWFFGLRQHAGRHSASLEGGLEGFYARRSSGFRANARRARRVATREGVKYEVLSRWAGTEQLLATWSRIQAIERRSWKGLEGFGIDQEPMRGFYRDMVLRLSARGTLRVVFARLGDRDIAFVFGGIFGGTYRGLQVSFDESHRSLSPGVLVHLEMIENLAGESVGLYDLGTEMDYKSRWGETGLETVTAVVTPHAI
jgi:CelD/BcsL family acetyltransferase involved in cellulose biosynthesis